MNTKGNHFHSVLSMGAAMLIFGTIGIFRTYIPLPSALLACVRGIAGALFLLFAVKIRKRSFTPALSLRNRLSFLFTGCLIGLNWVLLFEAYRYTSVQTATLCYYMQPVIVILLSPLIFREKLTAKKLLCVLAACAGMGLISGYSEGSDNLRGIIYGLGAAALYAGVVIFNKKSVKADAYEKTILQLSAAGVVLIPYLLLTGGFEPVQMNSFSWIMTGIVCIVHTGIAYMLYFSAIGGLKAQTVAVMGYIDPVSALFLSALFLHESMTPTALLGAVLIIVSALISELADR